MHISLIANPSHLEAVDPLVEGKTRALQRKSAQERSAERDADRFSRAMAVQLHGDAAFAGQGVVYETFGFAKTPSFTTGGTVHIVVNNQIGFTTSRPSDARSTPYFSDVAKMIEAPICPVNGDDPEAAIFVTRLALQYQQKFNKDVVIDMICYRRFGHNEGDEPSFTQPKMYQKIRQHPTTLNVYADKLIKEGTITKEDFNKMKTDFKNLLDEQFKTAKNYKPKLEWYEGVWSRYKHERGKDKRGITGVSLDKIKKIGNKNTWSQLNKLGCLDRHPL